MNFLEVSAVFSYSNAHVINELTLFTLLSRAIAKVQFMSQVLYTEFYTRKTIGPSKQCSTCNLQPISHDILHGHASLAQMRVGYSLLLFMQIGVGSPWYPGKVPVGSSVEPPWEPLVNLQDTELSSR